MTKKLFEAYKNGTYKPYNRHCIILHKPIENSTYHSWNNTHSIRVNDCNVESIEFDKDYIIYHTFDERPIYEHNICMYWEKVPGKTYKVHYKNIESFH